jgi:hypothetical protein
VHLRVLAASSGASVGRLVGGAQQIFTTSISAPGGRLNEADNNTRLALSKPRRLGYPFVFPCDSAPGQLQSELYQKLGNDDRHKAGATVIWQRMVTRSTPTTRSRAEGKNFVPLTNFMASLIILLSKTSSPWTPSNFIYLCVLLLDNFVEHDTFQICCPTGIHHNAVAKNLRCHLSNME